jgi:hypothetical protein
MPDHRHSTDLFADRTRQDDEGWHVCSGLAFYEMEQLLDWLEQCHCPGREVRVDVLGGTVRWRHAGHGPKGC